MQEVRRGPHGPASRSFELTKPIPKSAQTFPRMFHIRSEFL